MKNILLFLVLTLISLSFAERANNVEVREKDSCPDFPDTSGNILSVSDCVDYDLYNGNGYYHKCCFMKILAGGQYYNGCTGLTTEEYMDITYTISKIEETIEEEGKESGTNFKGKVYQLECEASYVQIFALAFALFGLLF